MALQWCHAVVWGFAEILGQCTQRQLSNLPEKVDQVELLKLVIG